MIETWVVVDENGGKWGPVDTEQSALNIVAAIKQDFGHVGHVVHLVEDVRPTPVPTLSPPRGFASWLDYAVATMDTRSLYLEECASEDGETTWPVSTTREDMRNAAMAELRALRGRTP